VIPAEASTHEHALRIIHRSFHPQTPDHEHSLHVVDTEDNFHRTLKEVTETKQPSIACLTPQISDSIFSGGKFDTHFQSRQFLLFHSACFLTSVSLAILTTSLIGGAPSIDRSSNHPRKLAASDLGALPLKQFKLSVRASKSVSEDPQNHKISRTRTKQDSLTRISIQEGSNGTRAHTYAAPRDTSIYLEPNENSILTSTGKSSVTVSKSTSLVISVDEQLYHGQVSKATSLEFPQVCILSSNSRPMSKANHTIRGVSNSGSILSENGNFSRELLPQTYCQPDIDDNPTIRGPKSKMFIDSKDPEPKSNSPDADESRSQKSLTILRNYLRKAPPTTRPNSRSSPFQKLKELQKKLSSDKKSSSTDYQGYS
jgi:hypothetical protein